MAHQGTQIHCTLPPDSHVNRLHAAGLRKGYLIFCVLSGALPACAQQPPTCGSCNHFTRCLCCSAESAGRLLSIASRPPAHHRLQGKSAFTWEPAQEPPKTWVHGSYCRVPLEPICMQLGHLG